MNKADMLLLTIERDVRKHDFTAYVPAGDAAETQQEVLDRCRSKGWEVESTADYHIVSLRPLTPEERAKLLAAVDAMIAPRS